MLKESEIIAEMKALAAAQASLSKEYAIKSEEYIKKLSAILNKE